MSIKVVKCETKIKTVIGDISAIVTAICIRGNNITYEISYFNNGLSASCWINRCEFIVDVQEKKKAGLVNYDKIESEDEYTTLLITP